MKFAVVTHIRTPNVNEQMRIREISVLVEDNSFQYPDDRIKSSFLYDEFLFRIIHEKIYVKYITISLWTHINFANSPMIKL